MSDTFNPAELVPGCEVVIRTSETDSVIGVVKSVDEETQTVEFTDGRAYRFPEEVVP